MTSAYLLIAATLFPLAAFVVLVFLGKRLGNPLAGWVGTLAIAASFVCSLLALIIWMSVGSAGSDEVYKVGTETLRKTIEIPIKWIATGPGLDQTYLGYLDLS